MLTKFRKNLVYVTIVILATVLLFVSIRMNNYKEFTNYSIKTSYVNIIKYSNEISSDIEDILIIKTIPKHEIERIINNNTLLIAELYFIQTSLELFDKNKVISFEQYDVIQELSVKVSKSDDEIMTMDDKDLDALKQLNDICSNINKAIKWENEDILKHNLWISLINKLNEISLDKLK